jgi:hypothetical protein
MLNRKRFRLSEDTIALEIFGRKQLATQVPAGSLVTVESDPRPDDFRMVDVRWAGRKLVMFADDVEKRGERVTGASSPAT